VLQLILDSIFPKKCVGCKKYGSYLCADCIKNIHQFELICPECGQPSNGGQTHLNCRQALGLDGLWSLGLYKPPLNQAIQKLKYKWIKEISGVLTNIIVEYWARYQPFLLGEITKSGGEDWVVVPVPLHKKRENWRGFNQSALLAKDLASKLGLKYGDLLIRTKNTKSQVTLSGSDRRQNMQGAFALKLNCQLKTANCLLLDDVWTTGSTIKECCLVLKQAGAKKVWALTLAS
jgi:competence protein ComFC